MPLSTLRITPSLHTLTAARLGVLAFLAILSASLHAGPPTTTPDDPNGSASSKIPVYGAAYAWGQDSNYQLGVTPPATLSSTPKAVVNPSGVPYGFTALTGGAYHSLGILNGSVYAWGNNDYAQLGNGQTGGGYTSAPAQVLGLNAVNSIATGGLFNLAIQNGTVYAWGYNSANQIGDPNLAVGGKEFSPKAVTGLPTGATVIAAGSSHSLAIVNGSVWLGVTICICNSATKRRMGPVLPPRKSQAWALVRA